jgi:hypothetical protein
MIQLIDKDIKNDLPRHTPYVQDGRQKHDENIHEVCEKTHIKLVEMQTPAISEMKGHTVHK